MKSLTLNKIIHSGLFLILALFAACESKTVVEAPKKNLDPLPLQIPAVKGSEDPMTKDQWSLNKLAANTIWEKNSGSKAVVVMMIGTGIDYNHEDLYSNVHINQEEISSIVPETGLPFNRQDDDQDGLKDNFVGWDFVDNDGLAYDQYGHDTYLAGVIGGMHENGKGIKGICENVSLYPVRYINRNGQSNVPTLVKALNHIKEVKPHVVLLNLINLKFADEEEVKKVEEAALLAALKSASSYPIIIGAGNSGGLFARQPNRVRKLFALFNNIFVVTSIDQKGIKPFLANYSEEYVHTSAPGKDILTTAPGNKYKKVSSTSLAAAHVAGALALALSEYNGKVSTEQLYQTLISDEGSQPTDSMESYTLGRNTLDMNRFFQALRSKF